MMERIIDVLERRHVITTDPCEADECCGLERDADGFCVYRPAHPVFVNAGGVENGVCLACGSGVLSDGDHLRDDLAPCYGDREMSTRHEYTYVLDCAAQGCEPRHEDDGHIVGPFFDHPVAPYRVNGHATKVVVREVIRSEWFDLDASRVYGPTLNANHEEQP